MPSAITFGKAMPSNTLPDWEEVLSAAARLQRILPEAVLVGGSASVVYAGHLMGGRQGGLRELRDGYLRPNHRVGQ